MPVAYATSRIYWQDDPAGALYQDSVKVWEPVPPPPSSVYADRIRSLAPLSYWRLGELSGTVAVDEMGLHDGAYTGAPTLGVPGLVVGEDRSMQVAGALAQGMNAGTHPEYLLYSGHTIEAWFNTTNAGAGLRSIVVKQNDYGVFLNDNKLTVYNWGSSEMFDTGINVADGLRHHVAVSFDTHYGGTIDAQMYLDGVPVGPKWAHKFLDQTHSLAVGYNDFATQEFSGVIDEVAIYNRRLTANEISINYRAGTGEWLGWSPLDIPGLGAWIDPMQDTFVDGEPVTSYREHSSHHRTFVAASTPYPPIFRAGASHPYLEFSNPNYGMADTTLGWNPGLEGLTMICVVRPYPGASAPMVMTVGPGLDAYEMRYGGPGTNQQESALSYTTSFTYLTHPTVEDQPRSYLHILRVNVPAGRTDLWTDDVMVTGTAPVMMRNVVDQVTVGMHGAGDYPFFGTIHEALFYAGPVSDTDLALLRDYLAIKHNLYQL